MASTTMYNGLAMPDSVIGLALSSPGLCSPGLSGEQGWSPCSSTIDDELDRDYFRPRPIGEKARKRHTMMSWPMPPTRFIPTRPLSLNKYPQSSPSASISASSASSSDESSAVTLADAPSFQLRSSPRKAMTRRFFSAPAPLFGMAEDEEDAVHIVSPNVFDESLPLMPISGSFMEDGQDEEFIKMARLEASMSLLGVESGPRVGCYTISSLPRSSAAKSPSDGDGSPEATPGSIQSEPSPTAGLCLLRMAFSPEHQAPTLQEQMAFASGLGNMCAWASPMKQTYASADGYLTSCGEEDGDDDETEFEMLTTEQSERRYASRHIRQGVAASSASGFMDKLHQLSPISRLAYGSLEGDDDVSTISRPASQFSMAASTVQSEAGSPILHGALAATNFASNATGHAYSSKSVNQAESPALEHEEYSYLAENDAFLATLQGSPQTMHVPKSQSSHWPDVNGFNGNTLSPSLTTPQLNLIGTPASMHMVPSPCFEEESMCPSTTHEVIEPSPAILPVSHSTNSVLERPRPIVASRSVSFFARNELEVDHHQLLTNRRAPRATVADAVKVGEPVTEPTVVCAIPPRKASLSVELQTVDQPALPTSRSTTSIVFKDEPHPRHLLRVVSPNSEARISKSESAGYLGPKAMAQVREACRAKTVHLRGGDALADQLNAADGRVPPVPGMPVENVLAATPVRRRGILKRPVTQPCPQTSSDDFEAPPEGKYLPTLFVARTPSQRKRGTTGVAETEPENLARAKLGLRTDTATRTSTVHALPRMPTKSSGCQLQLVSDLGCAPIGAEAANVEDGTANVEPALLIAAELQQSGGGGMARGFVLVVEETQTIVTDTVRPTSVIRM